MIASLQDTAEDRMTTVNHTNHSTVDAVIVPDSHTENLIFAIHGVDGLLFPDVLEWDHINIIRTDSLNANIIIYPIGDLTDSDVNPLIAVTVPHAHPGIEINAAHLGHVPNPNSVDVDA